MFPSRIKDINGFMFRYRIYLFLNFRWRAFNLQEL